MNLRHFFFTGLSALILAACTTDNTSHTRGAGIYPGSPDEYDGPIAASAGNELRNLALMRAAWASSSIDYNLTAQLVTDGIISGEKPCLVETITSEGPVPRNMREKLLDNHKNTRVNLKGNPPYVIFHFIGGLPAYADRMTADATFLSGPDGRRSPARAVFEASEDGKDWFPFEGGSYPWYKATFPETGLVNVREVNFIKDGHSAQFAYDNRHENSYRNDDEIDILPSKCFTSCGMSEGNSDEWLCIDLGKESSLEKVILRWINKAVEGRIMVSDDGESWEEAAQLPAGEDLTDEIAVKGKARYVKVEMKGSIDGKNFILSEMEVLGRGGVTYVPQPAPEASDGRLELRRGAWMLRRASEVKGNGESISTTTYDPKGWLPATVPGTVAASYENIGAIPRINYDMDQLQISESYFLSDFWYRDTFTVPEEFDGKTVMLEFDGINWKADIYLNGAYVGAIDGCFTAAEYDVTRLVRKGEENALAVLIHQNANPGAVKETGYDKSEINGGILGADNPTFHATIGWDWIPTVRGRDIGIWNDVRLTAHDSGVTIDDVFIDTDLPLPSTAYADISTRVSLTNHSAEDRSGKISVSYGPLSYAKDVVLKGGESATYELDTQRFDNPELWWPAGYGEPALYDVSVSFLADGKAPEVRSFKSGVREMSYTIENGILDMFINGRRFIGNGGNWGFPEIYQNYRSREYDAAVAYHADMGFNMIRNWVGMTGDEEFYEACDRHGVTVWQDFWLANPADGPDPDRRTPFMTAAASMVKMAHTHPSISLYCGRNEGFPPTDLNGSLKELVDSLHPGIIYIPSSADEVVTGHGPYRALSSKEYFTFRNGADHFHSERGMPNVPNPESLAMMLRPENQWPQGEAWGHHDYIRSGAQSCGSFNQLIENAFGPSSSMEEFAGRAQWLNYDGYRAMFESRSAHRMGLLLWMSHPAWPSMVWQTYDYYLDPTAAYFGAKKGCAPLRIQYNPVSSKVEVVNLSAGNRTGLTARAKLLNSDGSIAYETSASLDSREDSTVELMELRAVEGLSRNYYIQLELLSGEDLLADNFYWQDLSGKGDFREIASLPKAQLKVNTSREADSDGMHVIRARITNTSQSPAPMVRLCLKDGKARERILPVFYQDNYFHLLAGESKEVLIRYKEEDAHGGRPIIEASVLL